MKRKQTRIVKLMLCLIVIALVSCSKDERTVLTKMVVEQCYFEAENYHIDFQYAYFFYVGATGNEHSYQLIFQSHPFNKQKDGMHELDFYLDSRKQFDAGSIPTFYQESPDISSLSILASINMKFTTGKNGVISSTSEQSYLTDKASFVLKKTADNMYEIKINKAQMKASDGKDVWGPESRIVNGTFYFKGAFRSLTEEEFYASLGIK